MKRIMTFALALFIAAAAFAQDQEKGKSQPATKATPPTEQGDKAIPATPSPNAEHGMEKKAENMAKRDAKKAEMAAKKAAKKEAKAQKKAAKKAAKAEQRGQ